MRHQVLFLKLKFETDPFSNSLLYALNLSFNDLYKGAKKNIAETSPKIKIIRVYSAIFIVKVLGVRLNIVAILLLKRVIPAVSWKFIKIKKHKISVVITEIICIKSAP